MEENKDIINSPEQPFANADTVEAEQSVENQNPAEAVRNGDTEQNGETSSSGAEQTSPSEKKKGKFRLWWEKHKPTKRRLIQVYVALLTNANIKGFTTGRIYTGATKNLCVPGLNCYSCPGAVGACPLGALQNAFAQSGTRTPYYVIGIILLLGLLFARTICGFFCPMGLLQDLTYKIKTPKLKKSRVTRVLSYFKYVILAVMVVAVPLIFGLYRQTPVPAFCKYICPAGTLGGAIGLLLNPANANMYNMLHGLFTWKFAVLVVILVASVFIYRFFCRFLCPLGALYGFFNRFALLGIKLDKSKCTDCGLCISHCKMDVCRVGDHECINCGECIDVCPAKAISWKGSKFFVHQNAVEPVPAPEDEKPLSSLLKKDVPVAEPEGTPSVIMTESEGTLSTPMTESEGMPSAPVTAEVERKDGEGGASSVQNKEETAPEQGGAKASKKKHGKAFWLQLAAWIAAIALLIGAFVYYNFVDKTEDANGNKVGDVCYDFSLPIYNGEGNFTLSEHRGKIVFINFWATWCGPCVTELPEFECLAEAYPDDIEVVAIHSSNITEGKYTADDVQAWLDKKTDVYDESRTWAEWTITFAQDSGDRRTSETFAKLGGRDSYPVTLVVDRDGVIRLVREGSITYELLEEQVQLLMNEEAETE